VLHGQAAVSRTAAAELVAAGGGRFTVLEDF
jgi:hypothetical protein